MYIIRRAPNANGSRPSLQTWELPQPPAGYAACPEAFYDVFYSTSPAGFVTIEVEGDTVTAMEINWEAYDAYVAAHPETEETDETVDYDAVLLDHDYRLLCLETGLTA